MFIIKTLIIKRSWQQR